MMTTTCTCSCIALSVFVLKINNDDRKSDLSTNEDDLPGRSAIRAQEADLDIRARSFWSRQQEAFLMFESVPTVFIRSSQPAQTP